MPPLDTPVRIAVAGAAGLIWLAVLLACLAASDPSLSFFDTVRVNASGATEVLTRFNPLGIILLAAFVSPVLAGLAFGGAKLMGLLQSAAGKASREAIQHELTRTVDIIVKLIDVNSSYRASLGQIGGALAGQSDAEQVRKIVSALLAEHQSMRAETQRLADELEGKQAEKREVEEKLSQVEGDTRLDTMTGVGNRRAFDQEFTAAIHACRAAGVPLSLVMADIDHFKRVNDNHGHQIGDEVLKMLAKIIKTSVRDSDVPCRYGGEEFAVVMPKCDLEAAKAVAERIRKKFESRKLTLRQSGQSLGKVTASFGVAEMRVGDDATTLLQRADRKLYAAKSAGRNRVLG